MKIIIRNLIKYLLISSVFFVVFFFSIILYHLIPFFIVGSKDIYGSFFSLIKPSFFHALYNSFIWASVVFTIFVLAKTNKNHILTFFIPIICAMLFIGIFHLIFRPTPKTLNFNKIDDLRILFTKKTFLKYKDFVFFFKDVGRDKINNIIIAKDDKLSFVKQANVKFLEDAVLLHFPQNNNLPSEIFFPRKSLINYNSYISFIPKLLIKWMTHISYLFVFSHFFYPNIILWGAFIFLLVSFFDFFRLKDFLLLSFLINFLLIFLIYFLVNNFYLFYKTITQNIIGQSIVREVIFAMVLLFIGLILFGIKILFFKEDKR